MGDPGHKARKQKGPPNPRRAREATLDARDEIEEGADEGAARPRKARGLDKNWAATGTQGSSADASPDRRPP